MEKLSLNATPEELAEMDFSELDNKIIPWLYSDEVTKVSGRVALIDYSIGLTIVKAEDTNYNLTCGNGPLSKNPDEHPETYHDWFISAVNMIISGYYKSAVSTRIEKNLPENADACLMGHMYPCAYSS